MSDVYGGFAILERGEAERLRRDLDDARAALATVTLDRDVWRAQAEQAVRERDEARLSLDCVTHDRNLTERERDEARADVATACAAMGHGSDDARWKPGETAVDALIRERDEARADADYHRSRAESWQATAQTHMEQRDEARAAVERLTRERAEDDAEVVTYKGEVLRLRVALMRAERERDVLREEVTHLRLEVELAERRGAEAMREAAARIIDCGADGKCKCGARLRANAVRALPLPGDEP